MAIDTGSSVLRTVYGSVLRIYSHGGATYTLFLRISGATVRVKKKLAFFLFAGFWPILAVFCKNFAAIKKLYQKSKCASSSH